MVKWLIQRAAIHGAIGIALGTFILGITGALPGAAQQAGVPPQAQQQEAEIERGFIGIFPAVSADTVGAPSRLIVRGIAPDSPAHFAGIEPGDEIVAVDGKPLEGQKLSDIVAAIGGEVGTSVKLALSRRGQSREVLLTRVAPDFEHRGNHMGDRREIEDHGKMGGASHSSHE